MTISARLKPRTELALARYCRTHGLTKTQALERGIALLLEDTRGRRQHPAWVAFERLREEFAAGDTTATPQESIRGLKQRLDEKYPA